jgi:Rieske Fe-S protein
MAALLPEGDEPAIREADQQTRVVAFGQQCSHLSCAVIPEPERGQLRCPCHNGYFEINEGRPIAGPPRRPLPRVTLAVWDGVIYATGVELRTV